jgi:hypothetical protein
VNDEEPLYSICVLGQQPTSVLYAAETDLQRRKVEKFGPTQLEIIFNEKHIVRPGVENSDASEKSLKGKEKKASNHLKGSADMKAADHSEEVKNSTDVKEAKDSEDVKESEDMKESVDARQSEVPVEVKTEVTEEEDAVAHDGGKISHVATPRTVEEAFQTPHGGMSVGGVEAEGEEMEDVDLSLRSSSKEFALLRREENPRRWSSDTTSSSSSGGDGGGKSLKS